MGAKACIAVWVARRRAWCAGPVWRREWARVSRRDGTRRGGHGMRNDKVCTRLHTRLEHRVSTHILTTRVPFRVGDRGLGTRALEELVNEG